MARIRTIKPSLWDSEKLGRLPIVTRLTFIGLIALADDEGRGRGSPAYLKGALHAYADDVTAADVAHSTTALHQAGVVVFYEVGGCRYYALPNWGEHQRIDRPGKSAIPAPPIEEPALFGEHSSNDRRIVDDGSTEEEEGKGREEEGRTDNNRPERRGPNDLKLEIEKAARKATARTTERGGDYSDYRLPKNFGKYAGVYVVNVPEDECQYLIDKMKPGPMVVAALRWRIGLKTAESNGAKK